MRWILIATLLAAGVAIPAVAVYRGDLPVSLIGVFSFGAGVVMLTRARAASGRRLNAVEISSQGMTLRFSDKPTLSYSWKDPALKLWLVDYAAAVGGGVAGFREFALIPCAIMVGNGPVGISLVALKGIRQTARTAGVPVIDGTPDAISRNIYIGNWPDVPRPFSSVNPYA